MSGRVIHTPDPGHACAPGWTYGPVSDGITRRGDALPALPKGMQPAHPPRGWDYPAGTVWECDGCGQKWVSTGPPDVYSPGFVEFRRESRWEKRVREKREARQ